ncbi:DUF397 domain-containing protein [Streptomyces sp. NPDC093260]|uniref:DUF397 domain-containing protein n=1 Tax=Streptomyces sp. NPDC093260 TaxID=3155073 RepID=UPI0034293BE4
MSRPVFTSTTRRKTSPSGGGEGDDCAEIADSPARAAVRDSKAPARAALTFPAPAFLTSLETLEPRQ